MEARLRVARGRSKGPCARSAMTHTVDEDGRGVMAAKREVALAGIEVCDLAMDVAGGSGFLRGSPIERAYRDIRACKFHPFTMESTLLHAGRLALGVPCDHI